EAERVGQAALLPAEPLVHIEHNGNLGPAPERQRLHQARQSARMSRAGQRRQARQQAISARILHQDPGLARGGCDRRSHALPRWLGRRHAARGTWSRSRATLRNTYPSRAPARVASRATSDCGPDGRQVPPRSAGADVEPPAGTAGRPPPSTPPSSTSGGCDRTRDRPRRPPRTICSRASSRPAPVFDPKTGHGRRHGADYARESRPQPCPYGRPGACPARQSERVVVYLKAGSLLTCIRLGQFQPTISSDPGPGDPGGTGSRWDRWQQLILHETVTRSVDSTVKVLLKRKLGVQLIVGPDGEVTQHGDLADDRLAHAGGHNSPSVGIEVVNPYYPKYASAKHPWKRVIDAPWAHRRRYVVPTPEQAEAT